jgi:putative membrane protein
MSGAWHLDACCVAAVLLVPLAYTAGLLRLWHRAGVGRGAGVGDVALFTAGWLAVAVSVLSPLHALGTRIFAVHMVEHEILMIVAAPLLVLARPMPVLLWALPQRSRQRVPGLLRAGPARLWQLLVDPVVATTLHAAALWLWHMPGLFEAALADEGVHAAQHIAFLGTGVLFWWSVLSPQARRDSPGPAALALFVTATQTGLLGSLMTVSRGLWYPLAADPFALCGLTRLEDQQLAGLVMWVPASLVYLGALLWLLGRWLGADAARKPA